MKFWYTVVTDEELAMVVHNYTMGSGLGLWLLLQKRLKPITKKETQHSLFGGVGKLKPVVKNKYRTKLVKSCSIVQFARIIQ